jgi:type I restriction enzyme S subunit
LLGEDGENVVSRRLPLAFRVTGKMWVNNHAHVFQPREGIDIRLLTLLLEATDYSKVVSGSAQPKLTQEGMKRLLFQLPPRDEQIEIAARCGALEARVNAELELQAKLGVLRCGLMDDLLSGRVRVSVLEEVPA